MLSNSALKGSCHCEHIRLTQCKLREAISLLFRLLSHGVDPEHRRRIPCNDNPHYALSKNRIGIIWTNVFPIGFKFYYSMKFTAYIN